MNCAEIQNELVAYVLGDLNPIDCASVERHLACGCNDCLVRLQETRDSVELLWQAVPNTKLTDEFQREILTRALDSAPGATSINFAPGNLATADRHVSLFSNLLFQSFVAFTAGLLLSAMFHARVVDRAEPLAKEAQQKRDAEAVSLASPKIIHKSEVPARQLESTHLVSLRKRAGSSELRGFVLWDSQACEVHLLCFGLKQPPPGSQYSLWLIGPSVEVRAVDRLDVDEFGNCKAVVHWPEGEFNFARVTVEPSSTTNSKPSENVELTSNAFSVFPR